MIKIQELIFDYGERRAVDRISVTIPERSITALVGPNGAGKTTLMRCIAALNKPFSGSVHVSDINVHLEPRRAHRIMGYLPDTFGLYEELTLLQCLKYRAAAQGADKSAVMAQVHIAATAVDLMERLSEPVKSLSRGMRQRLALAQSIIHQPKVLILDEPASGLDPEARSGLSYLLRRLRDNGMTILVSSHILTELEDYSTHLLIMREGRMIEFCSVAGEASDKIAVTIELAHPSDKLTAALQSIPYAKLLVSDAMRPRIELPADDDVRVQALKKLVH
jgi:ABC-2 type transport system ATP-binding protein